MDGELPRIGLRGRLLYGRDGDLLRRLGAATPTNTKGNPSRHGERLPDILRHMSVDSAFLAKISLFAPLDDDERAVLAQAMVDRQVKPGEVLFRAGEPGDSMFIVVEGGIELSVKDKAGQKIVLHTPTAGEFFGELSLLDGGSRTATATAAEASSLYVLDREDMLQLFKKRPEAGLDMLGAMGRMTRKANALLQARVSRNVNEAAESKLSLLDRIADVIAAFSGSVAFLILNGVWFVVWIAWNVVPMPWFEPFDPFPFGLLTMIVSLEAIFLSCFVLISQDRQSAKDRVRSDIEYEVNVKAELEVAHLHEKTDRIHEEMLDRFMRIEKALGAPLRKPGTSGAKASSSAPTMPRSAD
jgi:CRP/FNR family cyclic AMP-dependent transcriptional regulator